MPRWLAEYRVKSDLTLVADQPKLVYRHPGDEYELHLLPCVDADHSEERLSARIFGSAEDLATADDQLDSQLRAFLHLLSFVTSTGYEISRKLFVIRWDPGIAMRECYLCSNLRMDQPIPALKGELLDTVALLQTWGGPPVLLRALRWFSVAVRAEVMEDQFQFFWYVVELIAVSQKDTKKVADRCQRCGGDLVCEQCSQKSVHRPFDKQAIAALLTRIGIPENLRADLFYIRNSLSHGEDRDTIEAGIQKHAPEFEFQAGVDMIGRAAWAAILNVYEKPPGEHRPEFLTVTTFVRQHMTAKAHMKVGIGGGSERPAARGHSAPYGFMGAYRSRRGAGPTGLGACQGSDLRRRHGLVLLADDLPLADVVGVPEQVPRLILGCRLVGRLDDEFIGPRVFNPDDELRHFNLSFRRNPLARAGAAGAALPAGSPVSGDAEPHGWRAGTWAFQHESTSSRQMEGCGAFLIALRTGWFLATTHFQSSRARGSAWQR
jgi:hypothetical protein